MKSKTASPPEDVARFVPEAFSIGVTSMADVRV